MNNQLKLHRFANAVGLAMICLFLSVAFLEQWLRHDLPCPLCLLQRIAFISIGTGLLMNLKFGIRPRHYAIILLSALWGLFASIRQVSLHLGPDDKGYGSLIFGLHFYEWSSIIYVIVMICTAIALLLEKGFNHTATPPLYTTKALMGLFVGLVAANAISIFLECGFHVCPDNPKKYILLSMQQQITQFA